METRIVYIPWNGQTIRPKCKVKYAYACGRYVHMYRAGECWQSVPEAFLAADEMRNVQSIFLAWENFGKAFPFDHAWFGFAFGSSNRLKWACDRSHVCRKEFQWPCKIAASAMFARIAFMAFHWIICHAFILMCTARRHRSYLCEIRLIGILIVKPRRSVWFNFRFSKCTILFVFMHISMAIVSLSPGRRVSCHIKCTMTLTTNTQSHTFHNNILLEI